MVLKSLPPLKPFLDGHLGHRIKFPAKSRVLFPCLLLSLRRAGKGTPGQGAVPSLS